MTKDSPNSNASTPERTPEPKSGFTSFWGSSADLKSSSSKSSFILFGNGRSPGSAYSAPSNNNNTNNNTQRPTTAPNSRGTGRRRQRDGTATGKRLQHSFSERLLRPKMDYSSLRPSSAHAHQKRLLRGSSASIRSMNTIRSKKGKTTLAYTQKYKYGLATSVYHPISKNTVNANKLKTILSNVLLSMSKKYGESSTRITAQAALKSILDQPPASKDIQELASKINLVDTVIPSESKFSGASHGGHAAFVFPWKRQPSIVRETTRTITLSPSYKPNFRLVKKWCNGRPALGAITDARQATVDHVRTKNENINKKMDEAMHVRSGMHAERIRRKQLIEIFLQAMATGGVDIRKVSETFGTIDADGSGNVDRNEFADAILSLDLNISTKQCGSLFDAIDIDQSGDLEINEFVEAITGTMRTEVRDAILAVVHSDDIDSLAIENEIKHRTEVKQASDTVVKRVKTLLAQRTFAGGAEAALMELFMKSDVDHSGSISRDEFAVAMDKLGVDLKKFEIDAVMNKADKDGGGELEYWEFVKMLRPTKKKKMVKQDAATDNAGGGGIPVFAAKHDTAMQLVYGRRSIALETQRLKRIQLHDQIEIFRPINAHDAMHALYVALASKHMTGPQLYEFFMDLDEDGSGTLDVEEFRHTMTTILRLGLTNPQLEVLAKTLDKDGNGHVNYVELKTALNFDKYEEGRQKRAAVELAAHQRSLAPKELVASKANDSTPYTRVLPFKPFGGHPVKKILVPSDGGRYATSSEAHRQWYCPGPVLKPLPVSLAKPFKPLRSYPQPKIKNLTRPLRGPATKPPYFFKNQNRIEASNFFSGMLGQRSLMEKQQKAMARSHQGSQYSSLPEDTNMKFSIASNSSQRQRSMSNSKMQQEERDRDRGEDSVKSMTVPVPKTRPQSQQRSIRRSKAQTMGPNGSIEVKGARNQHLTRASTAPTAISRYDNLK